jgi:hypothetical protein
MTLSPTQLDSLTEIPIFDPLPPDKLSQALGTPPFHPEASILNLRDLSQNGTTIPKAKIYRSGGLTSSAESTAWLSANVAKIFDLRGPHEHATTPDPHVAGVENVWIPPEDEVRLKNMMAEFAAGDGSAGWMTQYKLICRQYAGAFKAVLEHIRDTPEQPILFHCTGA